MRRIARIWHDELPAKGSYTPSTRLNGATSRPVHATTEPTAPSQAMRDDALPFVSVVVVARVGADALVRCLDALAAQSYPVSIMEVIVVCLSQRDDIATVVASQARRRAGLRFRYVTCPPGRGIAAARNCGWFHARGDLVAFTTDTTIPSLDWVAAGAHAFAPDVDVVGGLVVVPLPSRPAAAVREAAHRLQMPWSATNVFYRRRLLAELDGFDEQLGDSEQDATDLALTALARGAHFATSERTVVVHMPPAARWLANLRSQRAHLGEARLLAKHPHLYWQHVRSRPPLGIYSRAGLLLLGVAAFLGRRREVAFAAGAAWLALTIVMVVRAARDTSDDPRDVADLLITEALAPPISLVYRQRGALRERVWFL